MHNVELKDEKGQRMRETKTRGSTRRSHPTTGSSRKRAEEVQGRKKTEILKYDTGEVPRTGEQDFPLSKVTGAQGSSFKKVQTQTHQDTKKRV